MKNGDRISGREIAGYMRTASMGRNLFFHKETGSTNVDVQQLAEKGAQEGTLVVADRQNAGKGRRGRAWISPEGGSVYMSLLLRPRCAPEEAGGITLVMALAVLEAVRSFTGEAPGIKWPNDIVINKKKICGILTEMSIGKEGIAHIVVGVGINVNRTDFSEEIRETATSVYAETGKQVNRCALIAEVMYHFERYYEIYQKTWDLSGLMDKYNQFLVNCGKEVRVLDPKGAYNGMAQGINEKGELLVEKDGKLIQVYAGEVSVRGIYGYV